MEQLRSLVTRAQAGDVDAYGEIVRRLQDMAYGFGYAFLGDFHLAQDAAQEAFIEAYQSLTKLREPAAFPGWLRRIVHKHCDRLTRRKRVPTAPLEAAGSVASGKPGPADLAGKREMRDRVLAAIRALPDKQRMATTLFYINGYSQKDIAEFLDVPVTTVRKRLARSRSRLREGMMKMIDDTLKSFPLPERFADVLVQMHFVTERINPLAERMRCLTDDQMLTKSSELRRRLADGQDRDLVKAEAFALVREATRRALSQAHYDVQLVAGMILDEGWIVEQATGEGKTITCYPAAYMAVLEGMHVHVMTVNEFLANRDAELARNVFARLGVAVGCAARDPLRSGEDWADARRSQYQCDITYGHSSEFVFDHLRDTLRGEGRERIQGPRDFATIDEADTVLIDEARTPLIISQGLPPDAERSRKADAIARKLIEVHTSERPLYAVDADHPYSLDLTSEGLAVAERITGESVNDREPGEALSHQIVQALRAHLLYRKGREYVVRDGRVVMIDEATGRLAPGRQWSEGLHQAVETKEGLQLSPERKVLAAITYRQYFRQYRKLGGMTGTAKPQAEMFRELYGVDVAAIPTRRPVNRVDYEDRIFADADAKYAAIVDEVRHYGHDLGRPVLVGTMRIEQSEAIAKRLEKAGIDHQVLNARPERAVREAEIIASAGQRQPVGGGGKRMAGGVTVATNIAGRGTDIILGPGVVYGNCHVPSAKTLAKLAVEPDHIFPPESVKCCIYCPEYDEATRCAHCFKPKIDADFPHRGRTACPMEPPCGLHVVGACRQESRRIDDQLRTRAGRQGNPGSSRFFLSLDEDLMDRMPEERKERFRVALQDRDFIEAREFSKAIEKAQKDLEQHTFEIVLACENRAQQDSA